MNKTELIDLIAKKAELTKASALKAVNAVTEAIIESLQNNDPVVWLDFGTFTLRKRAARVGHNPRTREKIKIKETTVVAFKAGKALKEAVKKKAKEAEPS
jgi:DNA-binding protein HU-beta